jgi:hypothetical protein
MIKDYKNRYLAISAIWFERYLECSRTLGTEEFPNSVWRFYHSLLNLDEKELAIKNKVRNYYLNEWKPRLDKNVKENLLEEQIKNNDLTIVNLFYKLNEKQMIVELFEFIIQTIQDSGVGWPTTEEIQQFTITQE